MYDILAGSRKDICRKGLCLLTRERVTKCFSFRLLRLFYFHGKRGKCSHVVRPLYFWMSLKNPKKARNFV